MIQGGANTQYLMAALDSMSKYPELVDSIFVTKFINPVEAIGLKFFVRGKPYLVTINDRILFSTNNNKPIFG